MRTRSHIPQPASRMGSGLIVSAVIGAVLACAAAPLRAEAPAVELPPVVVERERAAAESENPRDATGTVTEIPREELARPGENLDAALDRQAGVSAVRLGGLGDFSAASIRGASFDQVLVFLDGIPLNAGLGGAVDLSSLPPAHLEKVEIFRSFSPVEASGSTLGGALFLTSREIRDNRFAARAGYGSFNTVEAGLFGTAAGEKTRVLAGLDYLHSRSDFSFLNDNGTPGNTADDFTQRYNNRDFDRLGTLLKAGHDLDSSTRIVLLQDLFYREGGLQRGGSVVADRTRLQFFRSITGLELSRNGLITSTDTLRLQLYNTFARSEVEDFGGEIWGFPQDTVKKSYTPGGAATWRGEAGRFALTGHLNYRFERYTPRHRIPTVFTDGTGDRHGFTAAAGGEVEIPEAKLLLALQYRLEHDRSSFRPANTSNPLNPPVVKNDETGHTVRGGVLWKPSSSFKARANIGRGLRFPSIYELFGDTGFVQGNPDLKPESGLNADIGFEASRDSGDFEIHAGSTFFYAKTRNLIQYARSTIYSKAENAGTGTIYGAETSLSASAWKTVRLEANHTFLDTKISSLIPSRDGRKSPNRPPNQWYVRGSLFRDSPVPALDRAELWTETEFTSAHYIDGNNRISVPERHILGAGLSLQLLERRLDAVFEAKNLTDENVMDVMGFPLPGRLFFGRLEWKFI